MQRAGSGGAYLEHAALHLDVERQDVAAQICQHVVRHERIPERGSVLGTDVALVGAGEAVHRKHGVMADHQLEPGIRMLAEDLVQPCGLDVALAAQAAP